MDCLFCKIIDREIPAEIVFENDNILAFKDINPQAKEHFLFIAKVHTKNIFETVETNPTLVQEIFAAIHDFTKRESITDFRVVTNNGEIAGQSVFHLHFHVLCGEPLSSFGS